MARRVIDDAIHGERLGRHPSSQQITRIMDKVLTDKPRMSGRRQWIVEMDIRDEIAPSPRKPAWWPRA
jgi:hypothetical protein